MAESVKQESLTTVLVALGANVLIAVAKSIAAALTGSASMMAEASHSWADSGNEVFLLVAERRSARPADRLHPLGYGRAAYVWAMFAGFGLFTAGSVLSLNEGFHALSETGQGADYGVAYAVLGLSAVLEGISFRQAFRQARESATARGVGLARYVLRTSETTVRSVFLEDFAALIGIALAAGGLALHEITGNAVYDAIGSILVGVLLGIVALVVIGRNAQFLVGDPGSPQLRAELLHTLSDHPDVAEVTFFHIEFVGPAQVLVVAAVDLVGDDAESALATRLQAVEDAVRSDPLVVRCVLTLSSPSDPGIA